MRPCRFYFSHSPMLDGFTDDTHWRGFLNVEVSRDVHNELLELLRQEAREQAYVIGVGIEDFLPAHLGGLDEVFPNERGDFDYSYQLEAIEVATPVGVELEAEGRQLLSIAV
jgi:hypothetical protein